MWGLGAWSEPCCGQPGVAPPPASDVPAKQWVILPGKREVTDQQWLLPMEPSLSITQRKKMA